MKKVKQLTLLSLLLVMAQGVWATDPDANLESYSGHAGSIHVSGWAYDENSPKTNVSIHIYLYQSGVQKAFVTTSTGNVSRQDVLNAKGSNINLYCGFDRYVPVDLPAGTYEMRIAAYNIGAGNNNWFKTGVYVTVSAPYSVSYNANGGSGAPSAGVKRYGINMNLSSTVPTRDGYTFAGWATSADGSVAYAAGATYTGNANLSLYAHWTPINYTISYDLGGGSVATENPTGYTIESAAITLNNPTKDSYTFAGWTGTGLDAATTVVTIAAGSMGNRSYTATWYNNDDVTAAAATDALISAICNPVQYTEACVTAINAARTAYDALSDDGKALVANLAALTAAEAALDEADEAMAWAANEDTDPSHAGDYYSTFYHSAVRYSLPEGAEAYIATLSSDALNLTRIAEAGDVIPENNAVILKGNSSSITLTPSLADPVTVDPAQNSLQGYDDATDAPSNCYVLSGHSSDNTVTGVGFYKFTGEIPAHKAFVVISDKANSPKRLRFVFNETNTATGIEQVEGQNGTEPVESTKELRDGQLVIIKNGVKYNAQGQMLK